MILARRCRLSRIKFAFLASVALSVRAWPAQAQAVSADKSQLEEITVTARRVAENLQETPISATVVTAAQLDQHAIYNLNDLGRYIPNLDILPTSNNLTAAAITIRGLGSADPILTEDPRVGTYIDGVYNARTAAALLDLLAPERVEILRGPQGTLYGRNTIGGAINVISAKPSDVFGASGQILYGAFDRGSGDADEWRERLTLDTGDIAGTGLKAKIAYQRRDSDGYVDNVVRPSGEDPGAVDSDTAWVGLSWAMQRFSADYSFDYDQRHGWSTANQIVAASPSFVTYFGRSAALGGQALVVSPDRVDQVYQSFQKPIEATSWGHTLTLQYVLNDDVTLKSITGYRQWQENVGGEEYGASSGFLGPVLNTTTGAIAIGDAYDFRTNNERGQHQVSEELQLLGRRGDFSYVSGLYYFDEDVHEVGPQFLTAVLANGAYAAPSASILTYTAGSKSYAAYGQATWTPSALAQHLALTGGLRYTSDSKSLDQSNLNGAGAVTLARDLSGSWDNLSGDFTAKWKWTDEVNTYFRYARGFKSGGFSPRSRDDGFGPETADTFEVGLKSMLLNNRVRFNIDGFYNLYDHMQISQIVAGSGGATTITVNAGQVDIYGTEADLTWLVTDALLINGGLGLTDYNFKAFPYRDPVTNVVSDISGSARLPDSQDQLLGWRGVSLPTNPRRRRRCAS